jgi:penicillin-binding protein 2
MDKEMKKRCYILSGLFLLTFLVIVLKLSDLQVVHGQEYDEASQNRIFRERDITAQRGLILDRNGLPLAVNRQGFNINIVYTGLKDDELNDMLYRFVCVLEGNGDNYRNSLGAYLTYNPLTFNNKKENQVGYWQTETLGVKKDEVFSTPQEVFNYLRSEKFKIDEKYTDEQAYKIMLMRYEILKNQWIFENGTPIGLADDVSTETVSIIEEQHHKYPGMVTDIKPLRKYIDGQYAAHLLGYVRGIDEETLKELKDEGYDSNDIIGQTGIELAAERYLSGYDGRRRVEVNTKGRLTDELSGEPAIPGNTVVLTIDSRLQKTAMESLEKNIKRIRESGIGGSKNHRDANAGAVVAIDVNTGEILAMASYPTYDPSIFLADSADKDAQKAIQELFDPANEDRPAFNRAISGKYAPGSTFKPITAIAALEEGIITPEDTIYDSGKVNIGGWDFWCLEYKNGLGAHGKTDLKKALETSCNIYFHEIGFRTGIDNIEKWARHFGLGEKTGIDILGESKGTVSSKEYKEKVFNDVWRPADTAQSAIGQLYNEFTPLQLANYISTLANGGKRYKPHLIKRVLKYDGSIVNEISPEYEQLPVKPENLEAVKEGMIKVTHSVDGTASEAFKNFPVTVAGKTGTAETGYEKSRSSNALFVCYAPAEKPEIAIAVVIEKGVWGSYTAPVARDILEEYFGIAEQGKTNERIAGDVPALTR